MFLWGQGEQKMFGSIIYSVDNNVLRPINPKLFFMMLFNLVHQNLIILHTYQAGIHGPQVHSLQFSTSKRHKLYDILYIFFHIYNTEYLFSSTVIFLRNSLNNDFFFWFSGAMIVQIISVTVIYQWVISVTQMVSDEEVEWNAWFVNTDLTLNLTYCKWHRMTSYIIGWQFFRVHLYSIFSSAFRLWLTFGISFSRWFRFWFSTFLDDEECNST